MKPLKKLWDITPAVIIGKKVHKSLSEREKKPKEAKKPKPLAIDGQYLSSHPAIHGHEWLKLMFDDEGVNIYDPSKRKTKDTVIKHFDWNEIIGYEYSTEDKTQLQTTQRLTVTRMATLGVFSLAAPKKKTTGTISEKFYDILHTTTGDIELENTIGGGGSGSVGDISRSTAQIAINMRTGKSMKAKRFVNEHLVRH